MEYIDGEDLASLLRRIGMLHGPKALHPIVERVILRCLEKDPRARRIVVCLEHKRRITDDGIEVLPVKAFIDALPDLLTSR